MIVSFREAFPKINLSWGLKQGDPLARFLFLLVAEGLQGLLRMTIEKNRFTSLKLGTPPVEISHLQNANDTLHIGGLQLLICVC